MNNTSQKETLISKSFPLRNINVCYILSNYDFDIDILFVDPISKIEKERETKIEEEKESETLQFLNEKKKKRERARRSNFN